MDLPYVSIGTIHTPYQDSPPHQPDPEAEGEFFIELESSLEDGLFRLDASAYIYVLFLFDRADRKFKTRVKPPWAGGVEVGLFASRSPNRPNPIGLSIVRLKRIEGPRLYISGIDVLDRTPVLDIKPYLRRLDVKEDANNGWQDQTAGGTQRVVRPEVEK